MQGSKVFISGRPGVGKTSAIISLVKLLGKDKIAGFYTYEFRDPNGDRLGFYIEDFNGNREIMAHKGLDSSLKVGSYGVDIRAIEKIALPAIERGVKERKIIIIDELGKMEFMSGLFVRLAFSAICSDCTLIAAITAKPHPIADDFKKIPGVRIIEIDRKNRDLIPQMILDEIGTDLISIII